MRPYGKTHLQKRYVIPEKGQARMAIKKELLEAQSEFDVIAVWDEFNEQQSLIEDKCDCDFCIGYTQEQKEKYILN